MDAEKIKTNIKRFFSNPNTLTFLLVIVLIIGVYFVYSYMLKRAEQPANIPYSTQRINAKTEITDEMVSTIKISGSFVTSSGTNLIQNRMSIISRYVAEGYQIPEKSFFYQEQLVDEKTAEKTTVSDAPDGFTVFALKVNFHSTYGCSIMPGNYIDLYVKTKDDDLVMFGKFIESLKVTKVINDNGLDVFATTADDEKPNPSKIYFLVPIEYFELLKKAELAGDIEIIPVPRNAGYSEQPKETAIVNDVIEAFITAKTVELYN